VNEELVDVEFELPEELLLELFMAAHRQNITFNDFMNQALRKHIGIQAPEA
jgi:hypothetical protein